ncbi:putative F-box/LRR-repeat protein At5g02930 [Rutidosis leptorrhynchoides]|uniref:putative F-box/LRR-repeat protein At5g02930 n=1 Tax=Rutidosis leptorrhynchoides TaxID=125765 RepID=UPI003A99BED3
MINRIQSFLPAKEAGRTCVLSKSWLHDWSTIPKNHLRFRPPLKLLSTQQLKTYSESINCTLQRWIHTVASGSSLKELYLTISVLESIALPYEIFLGENLETISVKADPYFFLYHSLLMSNNLVIKCVNLRVLELIKVTLSDETLVNLLSTCILLEKINLSNCKGLSRIKVKNLCYLPELEITPGTGDLTSEIYDVPSLHIFKHTLLCDRNNFISVRKCERISLNG